MVIDKDTPVGVIAREQPRATREFHRLKIDFCCGGGVSLQTACDKLGLDCESVLQTLQEAGGGGAGRQWTSMTRQQMVDAIIEDFHVPLRAELDRLQTMMAKVLRAHGEKDPLGLERVAYQLAEIADELRLHMRKEEEILFPLICGGGAHHASAPMVAMETEHVETGEALALLRELTNDFTPPEYACTTWRALWSGMSDLERDIHEHVHVENNVLFPDVRNPQGT